MDDLDAVVAAHNQGQEQFFNVKWQPWGGFNDRFAFGSTAAMQRWGTRLDFAKEYSRSHVLASERFLKYVMTDHGTVNSISGNITQIQRKSTTLDFVRVRVQKNGEAIPWKRDLLDRKMGKGQSLGDLEGCRSEKRLDNFLNRI